VGVEVANDRLEMAEAAIEEILLEVTMLVDRFELS
jgi:hypothetical protein